MSTPIIILALMRRHKRVFKKAQATSPATSILPADYGIRNSIIFQKLVRQGILIAAGDGRYYLDENRDAQWEKNKQKVMVILLAILIIGFVVGYFAFK